MVKKSPRPRTQAQRQASQQNGRKSQGPKTPEGKSKSRTNALKHGLSSQNPTLLPPDLTAEVRAEVDLFTRDLKPQTHIEQRLVETAALSCVRFLRLSHAEVTIAQSRARTAIPNWQAERKASVIHLAKTLDANRPGTTAALDAIQALKQTSHGCKLLAARYQKLIDDLTVGWHDPESSKGVDAGAGWHDPESSKGVDAQLELPPFTLKHLETLARLEAFNGTIPDPSDSPARKNLWRHLIALMTLTRSASEASSRATDQITRSASEASSRTTDQITRSPSEACSRTTDEVTRSASEDDGSPTRQRGFFPASPDDPIIAHIAEHFFAQSPEPLPDPDTARRKPIQYLSKRKHTLTQRARYLWETQDRPARDEAPARALFDPTPEGKLLARYMNDAQRTMRLALKELQKAQNQREKRPNSPPTTDHPPRTTDKSPIKPNTPQPTLDSRVTPHPLSANTQAAPHKPPAQIPTPPVPIHLTPSKGRITSL